MAAGDQGWYSLEGVLYMKTSGGLNYLIPKKKLYFALNECENSLVFYKDKADFCRKKDKQGSIKLANSACTLLENNRKGFVIHADGKKYEFEGENESSADCWLHALRHRKETDINDNLRFENSVRSRSHSASDEENGILSTAHLTNGQPYHRTISKLGSDSGTSTEPTPLPTIRTGGDCEAPGESGVGATSEEPVPGWLDHWVSGWVNEQPYMAAIDEEHPLCENGEEDEELTNSGEEQLRKQSASTSTFDSRKRSSVCSNDIFMCDELHRLRVVDGRQKQKIQQLAADKTDLEIEVERLRQRCKDDFEQRENAVLSVMNDTSKTTLVIQNRFLNSEVIRLNERCQTAERKLVEYNKKIASRDMEMQEFKREYVYLLQSCIRIPISEHTTGDVVQVKLFGGNLHERRVRKLLEVARQQDPTLPTFENVCNPASFHVDEYGFRHTFEDVSLALHYICTQLHNHYQSQLESHKNHKRRWKIVLDECDQKINNTHETRSLCRAGIPRSLRSTIWRILIHQQVADLKTKFGKYYFRNLCSSQGTPADRHYCANHQKQVTLDLLRTMPNNVHFMSATCKGVTQLQSVLRAYCLHNGSIGYCQGMNFIAATCLLFVGPEDTFWFLIAVTERYFDRSYFDQSLTGAQADQEVLKELVELKFPKLARHLDMCDIDLTTVTLNWFLALFFDAVPFLTMLRIWDCFLLEGPKILFRFAIALLGIHETEILEKTDTISVMKVLKAAVRLTYDIDGLIKMAFDQLSPFPTREQLHAKQLSYLKVLHERLNKRQQIRNQLNIISFPSNSLMSNHLRDFPIEGIRFNNDVPGVGYIFAGHHKKGKLALIHMTFERAYMTPLNIEFDCRVVSMVIVQADMAFVSLLSGYIVALHLQDNQCATLWELKLNDVALKLVHSENRVYAALANGTLTVLENVFEHTPSALDLYHIPIGAAPITDAILVDDHLWLAVACKIVILHRFTLTTVGSIYVASSANGSAIPMFDKIRSFSHSAHGVWLMTAHSSLVQLWREEECVLLYDITYDHSHRKPSFDDSDEPNPVEINSLLYHDDTVWVGTTDGYLLLYAVNPIREEVRKKCSDALFSLYKYPPGRRLSPSSNFASEIPIHKQPTYYIPTLKETQHEEIASVNEYPESERRTRKISVIIDQSTKKYSVSVAPIRKCSEDSFLNQGTGKLRASSCGNMSQFRKQSESTFRSAAARRRSLAKGSSMESNSSVFSSEDPSCTMPTPNYDPKYKKHESPLGSVQSIESEKDDLFDSESELPNQKKPSFGLMIEKEFRLSPTPQIPLRKLSCRAFGTFPLIAVASDRSSPENQFVTSQESPVYELQPKLRRKDLDFDETLVVAIKEPEGHEADISEDDAFKEEPDQFTEMECEVKSSLSLSLLMKLKISDKPVKCIEVTNFTNKDIVITGSGDYGDDEAILRWTKESKTGLWINDPLVDNSIRCRARTMFSVPSPSHRDENEERVCLTP